MDRLISVIIPTYNRKELTDMAVASVVTSFPSLVEIIVVDDCGSVAYSLDALNPNGVPIHVIKLDKNVGAGMARQAGVAQASGKFIAFLDSDDVFGGNWLDVLIHEYISRNKYAKQGLVYVGRVTGGKFSHYLVWHVVKNMPDNLRLWIGRIITIFFNPFYTPSIAMSKSICRFSDQLRYCEDYYTMVEAIFKAERLFVINELACVIGRNPNSSGGLSAVKMEMFKGEMRVRAEMLKADFVPSLYKIIVPVGMLYQLFRSLIKLTFMRR